MSALGVRLVGGIYPNIPKEALDPLTDAIRERLYFGVGRGGYFLRTLSCCRRSIDPPPDLFTNVANLRGFLKVSTPEEELQRDSERAYWEATGLPVGIFPKAESVVAQDENVKFTSCAYAYPPSFSDEQRGSAFLISDEDEEELQAEFGDLFAKDQQTPLPSPSFPPEDPVSGFDDAFDEGMRALGMQNTDG